MNLKEEENDNEHNDILCLNCGSSNFFRDENSDDLICSECNTQSQSLSQRETVEDDFSSLHTRGHRFIKTRSSSHIKTEDEYYTKDAVLPSLKVCVSAFLSLVEKAAICSVSVQSEGSGSGSGSGSSDVSNGDGDGDGTEGVMPSNMHTLPGFENYRQNVVDDAKEIFLLYLERFDESANYFMIRYPTLRISLRDRFLTDYLRDQLWLHFHLYDTDKKGDKDDMNGSNCNNHNRESSMKDGSSDDESDGGDGGGDDNNDGKSPTRRSRKGKTILSPLSPPLQLSGSSRKTPKQIRWDDSQQTAIFDGTQPSNASLLSQERDTIMASNSNISLSQDKDGSPPINYNFNRRKRQRDQDQDQDRDGQKEKGTDHENYHDHEQKQVPSQSFLTEHGFLNKDTEMKFGRYACDAGASKRFKKFSDESIYWKLAVLELNIDVNFLTSIVYLAHLCSRTGISSSHFLMWASDGKFPFLWDSYSELNDEYQKELFCIKSRFQFGHKYESGGDCDHRDELPDPSVLDRGVMLLLTSLVDTRNSNASDGSNDKGGRLDKLFRSNIERMKRSKILSQNITKFIREEIVKTDNTRATVAAANGDRRENAVEEDLVSEFKIVETNSPIRSTFSQEMEIEEGDGSTTMSNSPGTSSLGQTLGQMSQDIEATESVDTVGYGSSQDTATIGPSLGQLSQDSDISQSEDTTSLSPVSRLTVDSLDPQPFFNVGMMAAHFCAYLGVEDKVLDFTYALMGLPVYCMKDDERREEWLPPEVKLAHPSSLVSPLHVIAVIVAACKFTPGWTTWKVIRTSSKALPNLVGKHKYMNSVDAHNNDEDSLCDTSSDDSSMDLNIMLSKKKRNQMKRQRSQNKATSPIEKLEKKKKARNVEKTYDNIDSASLAPNFIDQDRPMRFDPLNFMKPVQYQKDDGKKKNSQFFKHMLSSSFEKILKKGSLSSSVMGNTILAGARLNEKKRKDHLKLDQSNGLSEYVAYNRLRSGRKPRKGFLTHNHVHEPYKMLLRYVAERLFIDKYKLHALVLNIDEEIRYTSSQRNPSCW